MTLRLQAALVLREPVSHIRCFCGRCYRDPVRLGQGVAELLLVPAQQLGQLRIAHRLAADDRIDEFSEA